MQLIDQIKKELKGRGVSVLKFSNETGISAYKVYKWFDGKGSPKHDDVVKLEKWLRKELEVVPRGTEEPQKENPGEIPGSSELLKAKDEIISLLKEKDQLQKLVGDFSGRIEALTSEVAQLKDLLRDLSKFFDPDEASGAGMDFRKRGNTGRKAAHK